LARVTFTQNLQKHLTRPSLEAPGATVAEVMAAIFAPDPLLRGYILDEQGRLRKHVNIYRNNHKIADRIRLSDPVAPDDELFVFQALSGG
jgi:sulfur-carrier protein